MYNYYKSAGVHEKNRCSVGTPLSCTYIGCLIFKKNATKFKFNKLYLIIFRVFKTRKYTQKCFFTTHLPLTQSQCEDHN